MQPSRLVVKRGPDPARNGKGGLPATDVAAAILCESQSIWSKSQSIWSKSQSISCESQYRYIFLVAALLPVNIIIREADDYDGKAATSTIVVLACSGNVGRWSLWRPAVARWYGHGGIADRAQGGPRNTVFVVDDQENHDDLQETTGT